MLKQDDDGMQSGRQDLDLGINLAVRTNIIIHHTPLNLSRCNCLASNTSSISSFDGKKCIQALTMNISEHFSTSMNGIIACYYNSSTKKHGQTFFKSINSSLMSNSLNRHTFHHTVLLCLTHNCIITLFSMHIAYSSILSIIFVYYLLLIIQIVVCF